MSQHYPIEDIDEPEVTAEQVQARVDDWLRRLHELFASIRTWAADAGWSVEDHPPILMNEEPMSRFGFPKGQQPTLSVRSPAGAKIWIKPKALWVIGANGRVDMFSQKGAFTLIDVADPLQKPNWILHRIGEGKGRPFDATLLADMV